MCLAELLCDDLTSWSFIRGMTCCRRRKSCTEKKKRDSEIDQARNTLSYLGRDIITRSKQIYCFLTLFATLIKLFSESLERLLRFDVEGGRFEESVRSFGFHAGCIGILCEVVFGGGNGCPVFNAHDVPVS